MSRRWRLLFIRLGRSLEIGVGVFRIGQRHSRTDLIQIDREGRLSRGQYLQTSEVIISVKTPAFLTTLSMNRFSLSSFGVLDGCVSPPLNECVNVKLIQLTTSPKLGFTPRLGNVLIKDEWTDSQLLFVLSEIRCEHHVSGGNISDKNVLQKYCYRSLRPHAVIFTSRRCATASIWVGVKNAI